MMLISVLFIIPIYYLANSKGYSGIFIATAAATIALASLVIQRIIPEASLVYLAGPPIILASVSLLKTRSGAPGLDYLNITFECPDCKTSITFPRQREGLAEFCPACGELVTVPTDKHSPKPTKTVRERPEPSDRLVCFDSFGRADAALQLVALLVDNGIGADCQSDDASGMLPHVGNTEGHRVMIQAKDWDDAVTITESI